MHELQLLHDTARFGAAQQAQARVAELGRTVEGTWAAAVTAQVSGWASGDWERLADAAQQFEAQGAALDAAESWTSAARLAKRAGHGAPAERAAAAAEAARSRCVGAHTPGLSMAVVGPLTQREREVAHLVAVGLTDKDVARRLDISVRTVNAHLRSIDPKLGVGGTRGTRRCAGRHLGSRLPMPLLGLLPSVVVVDPVDAVGRLADTHVRALLLEQRGLDAVAIGDRLGIPAPAVERLLQVARAKLAALDGSSAIGSDDGDSRLAGIDPE